MLLIIHLLTFVLLLTGLGLLGQVLVSAWERRWSGWVPRTAQQAFVVLFVGGLFVGFATAVVSSRGHTASLLLLLLLAWIPRTGAAESPSLEPRDGLWPVLALGVIVAFGWEFVPMSASGEFPWRLPYLDSPHYALVSSNLTRTGIEAFHNYETLPADPRPGITPYHFQELWLSAAMALVSGAPSLVAYQLYCVPYYHLLFILAINALLRSHGWPSRQAALTSVALFFAGCSALAPEAWVGDFGQYDQADAQTKKMGPWFASFAGFALFLSRQRLREAGLFLLSLGAGSVTALPAVAGGFATWALFALHRGDPRSRELASLSVAAVLLGGGRIGLQFLLGVDDPSVHPSGRFAIWEEYGFPTLRNMLGLTSIAVWRLLLVSLPYAVGLAIAARVVTPEERDLRTFAACSLPWGMGLWAVMVKDADASQFALLPAVCLLPVTISLAAAVHLTLPLTRRKQLAAAALAVVLVVDAVAAARNQRVYSYRDVAAGSYLQAVQAEMTSADGRLGACLMDPEVVRRHTYGSDPHLMRLGFYLLLMPGDAYCLTLSDFDLPSTSTSGLRARQEFHGLPFVRFVNAARREGRFTTLADAQAEFVAVNGLSFVIASRQAVVPPAIAARVRSWLTDPLSGERFGRLTPTPQTSDVRIRAR